MVFESDFTRIERTVSRCRPPSKLPISLAAFLLSTSIAMAIASVQVFGVESLPARAWAAFAILSVVCGIGALALFWKAHKDEGSFAMDIQMAIDEIKELRSRFTPNPVRVSVDLEDDQD